MIYPPSSEKYVPVSESPPKHGVTPKLCATEDSRCPSSWRFFKQPVKLYAEFFYGDKHGNVLQKLNVLDLKCHKMLDGVVVEENKNMMNWQNTCFSSVHQHA